MGVGWIFGRISVVAQYIRRILHENGGFWAILDHGLPSGDLGTRHQACIGGQF